MNEYTLTTIFAFPLAAGDPTTGDWVQLVGQIILLVLAFFGGRKLGKN